MTQSGLECSSDVTTQCPFTGALDPVVDLVESCRSLSDLERECCDLSRSHPCRKSRLKVAAQETLARPPLHRETIHRNPIGTVFGFWTTGIIEWANLSHYCDHPLSTAPERLGGPPNTINAYGPHGIAHPIVAFQSANAQCVRSRETASSVSPGGIRDGYRAREPGQHNGDGPRTTKSEVIDNQCLLTQEAGHQSRTSKLSKDLSGRQNSHVGHKPLDRDGMPLWMQWFS
jgi:hypothetical protein